jgi:hypothetical protein
MADVEELRKQLAEAQAHAAREASARQAAEARALEAESARQAAEARARALEAEAAPPRRRRKGGATPSPSLRRPPPPSRLGLPEQRMLPAPASPRDGLTILNDRDFFGELLFRPLSVTVDDGAAEAFRAAVSAAYDKAAGATTQESRLTFFSQEGTFYPLAERTIPSYAKLGVKGGVAPPEGGDGDDGVGAAAASHPAAAASSVASAQRSASSLMGPAGLVTSRYIFAASMKADIPVCTPRPPPPPADGSRRPVPVIRPAFVGEVKSAAPTLFQQIITYALANMTSIYFPAPDDAKLLTASSGKGKKQASQQGGGGGDGDGAHRSSPTTLHATPPRVVAGQRYFYEKPPLGFGLVSQAPNGYIVAVEMVGRVFVSPATRNFVLGSEQHQAAVGRLESITHSDATWVFDESLEWTCFDANGSGKALDVDDRDIAVMWALDDGSGAGSGEGDGRWSTPSAASPSSSPVAAPLPPMLLPAGGESTPPTLASAAAVFAPVPSPEAMAARGAAGPWTGHSLPSAPFFRKVLRADARDPFSFAETYAAYARLQEVLEEDAGRTRPSSILRARLLFGCHEVCVEMDAVVGGAVEFDDVLEPGQGPAPSATAAAAAAAAVGSTAHRDVVDGIVWLARNRIVYTDVRGPNALVLRRPPLSHPAADGGAAREAAGASAGNTAGVASAAADAGAGAGDPAAPRRVAEAYLVDYDDCIVVDKPVVTLDEYAAALEAIARVRKARTANWGSTFLSQFLEGKFSGFRQALWAAFDRAAGAGGGTGGKPGAG